VTASKHDTSGFDRVIRNINGYIERGETGGAALAVSHRGKQIVDWAGGNARDGVAAGTGTLWPLASISKVYTAAMIMVLVERGELSLGTTASSVLPGFTGDGREAITLRHLMTHTSGLIYESPDMENVLIRKTPYDEIVDEAYHHPLLFAPGSQLSYADYNFAIAGRMASQVTGKSFAELVDQMVLQPAGLNDTFMPPPESEYDRLAKVDGPLAAGTDGAMYNSPYALNLAHPAFGTVATASDLMRFGLLFAPSGTTRIHSAAGIRAMTTDQTNGYVAGGPGSFSDGVPRPWGIGFMIKGQAPMGGDLLSPQSFGHGGATGCTLWIDPVEDVVIAYVSNSHARKGRPPFTERLVRTVNGVLAAVTSPA
jgi:CubicO group peptidase (beta-lactamase class C family)